MSEYISGGLWPCPFCGGEAEEVITSQNTANPKYRIRCKVCGCQTPATVASPEHVRKWNRRTKWYENVVKR